MVPKKKWLRTVLINQFDVSESKVPELSYQYDKKIDMGREMKSKYSMEYLGIMLKITKYYKAVIIKLRPDYPLTIETEDFDFILAPRVE